MIDFDRLYLEIENILQEQDVALSIEFKSMTKNKSPKEVYLWCSANLKSVDHERLRQVLMDFYYSVR